MKTLNTFCLASLILTAAALSACHMPGVTKDPEAATFANTPISAPLMLDYEQQEISFSNNKMFLWREDMSSEHVAIAQSRSRQIDELDELAIPMNARKTELETEFKPIFDKQLAATKRLGQIKSKVTKLNKDKDAELKKPQPSPDVIKKIDDELAVLAIEKTQKEFEKSEADAVLAPVQKEIGVLQAELDANEKDAADKLAEIGNAVVWFLAQDVNPTVDFKTADDGSLYISISHWKLAESVEGDEKTFSTADGSIRNAKYTMRGGIYEFELVDGDVIYWFKVSRLNRFDSRGRIIFTGDIERRVVGADGKYVVTKGVAKFIDRKN